MPVLRSEVIGMCSFAFPRGEQKPRAGAGREVNVAELALLWEELGDVSYYAIFDLQGTDRSSLPSRLSSPQKKMG